MMIPSPILLLCDYIIKLDYDQRLALYYKQLATLLSTNIKTSKASYNDYIKHISPHSNCCLSFGLGHSHGISDNLIRNRLELIGDICSMEFMDLGQILQDLSPESVIESIKVLAKYIQAVHQVPTSCWPDENKLKEDYSQLSTLFSDFIEAFNGINFMCPFPTYDESWYYNYYQWQTGIIKVISGCSSDDLDGFVKHTKRIAAIDENVGNIKVERLKAIKILRVLIMACKQNQEKWNTTRKSILSILYPYVLNYTIYNAEYVDEIRALNDHRLAHSIMTALLAEVQCQNALIMAEEILADISGGNYMSLVQELTKTIRNKSENEALYLEEPLQKLGKPKD